MRDDNSSRTPRQTGLSDGALDRPDVHAATPVQCLGPSDEALDRSSPWAALFLPCVSGNPEHLVEVRPC